MKNWTSGHALRRSSTPCFIPSGPSILTHQTPIPSLSKIVWSSHCFYFLWEGGGNSLSIHLSLENKWKVTYEMEMSLKRRHWSCLQWPGWPSSPSSTTACQQPHWLASFFLSDLEFCVLAVAWWGWIPAAFMLSHTSCCWDENERLHYRLRGPVRDCRNLSASTGKLHQRLL